MPLVLHPEILTALDHEWRTAREVHARLGMWAPTSVQHMLLDLAKADMVESTTRTTPSGFVRLYRGKGAEATAAAGDRAGLGSAEAGQK